MISRNRTQVFLALFLFLSCNRQLTDESQLSLDSSGFSMKSQENQVQFECCEYELVNFGPYVQSDEPIRKIATSFMSNETEDTCLLWTIFLVPMHQELYTEFGYYLDSLGHAIEEQNDHTKVMRFYKLSLAVSGAALLEKNRRSILLQRYKEILNFVFFQKEIFDSEVMAFAHRYSARGATVSANPFEYQQAKRELLSTLRRKFECFP